MAGGFLFWGRIDAASAASYKGSMKWAKIRVWAVAAAFICSAGNAVQAEEINGEVFIVTKGGDNKRLGRVSVRVLDLATTAALVAKKVEVSADLLPRLRAMKEKAKADADKASFSNPEHKERFQTYLDWLCVTSFYASGRYFCADLPAPIAEGKTDSDGKYSIAVPGPGQYAVAAIAQRTIGSDEEHYYWLVSVDVKAGGPTSATLSNDNLASAQSSESIIRTCSPALEADNAVKGAKIATQMIAKLNEPEPPKMPVAVAVAPMPSPKTVQEAQELAVKKFPDIGVAGSKLNRAFLDRVQQYRGHSGSPRNAPSNRRYYNYYNASARGFGREPDLDATGFQPPFRAVAVAFDF